MKGQEYLESFLSYLTYELNLSKMTVENYKRDVEQYFSYVVRQIGDDFIPSKEDKDLVRGFLSDLMNRGLKATSVNRRLSALKAFYKYLVKCKYIDKNPVSSIRGPKQERPLPVYVPTKEVCNIINQEIDEDDPKSVRDRLIIAMLYECGLRRSELSGLSDRDVDTVNLQLKVLGKGNKERIIPFGENLKKLICQWRDKRKEIPIVNNNSFFVSLKGEPMKAAAVYSVVHKVLERVPNLSRRGAHALRHSFATDMMGNGADLLSIKELMGHNSVSTTVQYTHTSFKQLQQMYNAHPRAQKSLDTMDIRIKSLHFDATDSLKEFIDKKVGKLTRFADDIHAVEVTLKVTKPEVNNNKEAGIKVLVDGTDLYVDKVADTFEEAVDLSVDVLKRQLEKRKEIQKHK